MIIDIAQIVVAIALIVVILLQRQSAGLSGAFGGSGGGEFYHQRRGTEKILFRATISLAIIFFVLAMLNIAGL